jgi:hypothetical protein
VIATEGGFQANTDDRAGWDARVRASYLGLFRYVESRKLPCWLATCPWILANRAAGGKDPAWEKAVWIRGDRDR